MDSLRIRVIEQFLRESFQVFEQRIVALLLLLTVWIIISLLMVKYGTAFGSYLSRKIPFDAVKFPRFTYDKHISRFFIWLLFTLPVLTIGSQLIFITFITRPNIIYSNPYAGSTMASEIPEYEIQFDLPVDTDNIKFKMSPQIDGKWEYEKIWKSSLVRKVSFKPDHSILPDQRVVIYITGLRTKWDNGKLHEQPLEFNSPTIPQILSTNPKEGSTDFSPESNIEVNFDSPLGQFTEVDYTISPYTEHEVKKVDEKTHIIQLKNELLLDQEYQIVAKRSVRQYRLENNEEIIRGEPIQILDLKFKTAGNPLVESYSPKGNAVNPEESFKAVFTQTMIQDQVEKNFSITPEIKGEITWVDQRTFIFTPENQFQKNTTYKIIFSKGIEGTVFGETKEDINIEFKTAGEVKILSISPLDGSNAVEISSEISIEFDQPVDRQSVEDRFQIYPAIEGTFSWSKNLMKFLPSHNFGYETRYTISIQPGIKSVYGEDSTEEFSYSFTTKGQLTTIDFPMYLQQSNFTCGVVSGRMVLAYYGINLTEQQLVDQIGFNGDPEIGLVYNYGLHPEPIADLFGSYGLTTQVMTNWNVQGIANEIEQGRPVIVWWFNQMSQRSGPFTLASGSTGYNGMHAEVVYGFRGSVDNPTAFLMRDPWRGHTEYSTEFFIYNWSYINYTALTSSQ